MTIYNCAKCNESRCEHTLADIHALQESLESMRLNCEEHKRDRDTLLETTLKYNDEIRTASFLQRLRYLFTKRI